MNRNRLNNKGFVLTLDAAVAALIVVTVLIYASQMTTKSDVTQWSQYKMLSTGYDILVMLYNTGALQTMNESKIEGAISAVLPENYEMRLEIRSFEEVGDEGELSPGPYVTVGPVIRDNVIRTHGKMTFLVFLENSRDTYGVHDVGTYNFAEFWIWLK